MHWIRKILNELWTSCYCFNCNNQSCISSGKCILLETCCDHLSQQVSSNIHFLEEMHDWLFILNMAIYRTRSKFLITGIFHDVYVLILKINHLLLKYTIHSYFKSPEEFHVKELMSFYLDSGIFAESDHDPTLNISS